jgi:hypothetical protein
MTHSPNQITDAEFKEIMESPEVQDIWGAENAQELEGIIGKDYFVKFNIVNNSDYSGDLFLIQSDKIDEGIPAIRLFRGLGGQLVMLRD